MKLFRKVADPATYEAVVHDGPQMLTAGGTAGNTFQTHLVVQAGDVLGFFTDTIGSCQSSTTDNFLLGGDGVHSLPDGQSEDFNSLSGGRLQIQAELTPTNDFTLARVRRDRRRGTAKLIFVLPNPGKLVGTGKGAKVSVAPADATGSVVAPNAGPSDLLVKAKGSRKATLDDTGKVTLKLSVTYIPTGGDPKKQPLKVKLKKT